MAPGVMISQPWIRPDTLFSALPTASQIERRRKINLSETLSNTLDRVNVLGGDDSGHSGCVNALSWAQDGKTLLTAGDDTTVRIWSMDHSDIGQAYPFHCPSVIRTGHRANIFNAKMLPYSSCIATAAGDMQVRVFDASSALRPAPGDAETVYAANQCCLRILRCHDDSVKKIITEESPDSFLSLSEDGTVRQHDLRTGHNCGGNSCPAPLVDMDHELSTLTLSPLTPYQFVVAGDGPYGYLYDRRSLRRSVQHEWGNVPRFGEGLTTCVRRFGRKPGATRNRHGRSNHITGSRLSKSNGHELVLSYSGDGIYLFSTKDDVAVNDSLASKHSSVVAPNTQKGTNEDEKNESFTEVETTPGENPNPETDRDRFFSEDLLTLTAESDDIYQSAVPVVHPQRCYTGARNVVTVKDVNFLGPFDEWVVSGSDDGNFFIWDKATGALHGIYEGDSAVVNVIEGHPHFALLAVSGIDTSVKLFAPTFRPTSDFSRMENADMIMEANKRMPRSVRELRAHLLPTVIAMSSEGRAAECIGQ